MAKKRKSTSFDELRDFGFEQAAEAAGQPFIAPTVSTPTSTVDLTNSEIRDFGFEQAAIAAGQPFVQPSVVTEGTMVTGPTGTLSTGPTGTLSTGPTGPASVTYTATDGTKFTDRALYLEYQASLDGKRENRQSAFDLLYEEFSRYGLGSLVEPLRELISDSSISPSEFTLRLRNDPKYNKAYLTRFASNPARIAKGLRALSEAEYLELEDSYQDVMRRYGLPESYYTKGELGRQEGFEKFIEFDVSPRELEERLMVGQNRLNNAPPEVMRLLSDYYSDIISKGDALAYVLDPKNAIDNIKRKVTAAEIGAGASQAGLDKLSRQRAEQLGAYGVTGEQARTGFQQIAGGVERGSQLAAIYKEQPYGQETAEQEVFNISGAPEARRRRQKIIKSEEATFGGQTGLTGGALSRDRAGQY